MNELIKCLGKFLTRDVMYVIGGMSFLLSTAFAFGLRFNVIESITNNTVIVLFILGIAYILGYINQEVLSLSPILTTGKIKNPKRFLRWLYKRFTGSDFQELTDIEYTSEKTRLLKFYKEEELRDFERIITLKHIGSSVGSNWLISSIIILIACYFRKMDYIVWIISLYLLFASVALILLSWIKGMQQYINMNELLKQISNKST